AALVLRRTVTKGSAGGVIMEMPKYQMPTLRDLALRLWQRAYIFLRRAGTIIFTVTVVVWALLSFPQAGPGETQSEVRVAGRVASGTVVVVRPLGCTHETWLSLSTARAAREVPVSSLSTTSAIDAEGEDEAAEGLISKPRACWTSPTALAFLPWLVFGRQCIS